MSNRKKICIFAQKYNGDSRPRNSKKDIPMKVLLLGSGGRECAIAWKLAQSPKCNQLFIAPGNAGTSNVGENVPIGVNEFEKVGRNVLCLKLTPDHMTGKLVNEA